MVGWREWWAGANGGLARMVGWREWWAFARQHRPYRWKIGTWQREACACKIGAP
jgi:hypothetical protein